MQILDRLDGTAHLDINMAVILTYQIRVVRNNPFVVQEVHLGPDLLLNSTSLNSPPILHMSLAVHLRRFAESLRVILTALSILHAWAGRVVVTTGAMHHVGADGCVQARLRLRIWDLGIPLCPQVGVVDLLFQPQQQMDMGQAAFLKLNRITIGFMLTQYLPLPDVL